MRSSRLRLKFAAPLALVALTAAACGGSSSTSSSASPSTDTANAVKGGTLDMLGVGDVDYMDPNISYYTTGYLAARLYSRQLFTYGASPTTNTKALPDVATEVPTQGKGISSDGLTYTIKLRSGVMWDTSPARPVTAADFVRGVKRTCNPVNPFGGLPDFSDLIVGFQAYCDGYGKLKDQTAAALADYQNKNDVAGLKAVDDTTLQFTLTHPAAYFTDMLALTAFSAAPVEYDKYVPASAELAQHTISDGPYKIASYVPTKSIEFVRNPAWQAASDPIRKAYVDVVKVDETQTQDSVQQQLQTGSPSADLAWDTFPKATDVPGLVAKKDPNLNIGKTASSNPYLIYNIKSPNNGSALNKLEVRQALSYATSRDNIIQAIGGPLLNTPLAHVLPSSILGSQNFDPYPYDVNKAKSLLAQAGFPNGITLKFLYRNASNASNKTFQTVQQDWAKAGIKLEGVPVPNADFYTKYLQKPDVAARGVWDISLAGWGADWYGNSALSFFKPLFYGPSSFPPNGSNFGYYDSPTAMAAIDSAVKATQETTAANAWAAADKAVMADAPIYPITEPKEANYHASQVHNAQYIPQLQQFDPANVWLSKDKQGG